MVVGLKKGWSFAANCMLLIALGAFGFGFLASTPALANDGNSCIFTVNPDAGVSMIWAQGAFKYDAKNNTISIDGIEWEIDVSSPPDIYNGDQLVTIGALRQLGNRVKGSKATVVGTQAFVKGREKPAFRQASIIIHD